MSSFLSFFTGRLYNQEDDKDQSRATFRNCLLSIFRDTPNSWVLTGGTYSGINHFVGQVVREINMAKNQVCC